MNEHLPVNNQRAYLAASRYIFEPYLDRRKIDVNGIDNLPAGSAPYILAMAHRSLFDIPVFGQVLREFDGTQIHFVAKKELWKNRLMAKYLDSVGVIKYDRDLKMSKQPHVAAAMDRVLENNGVLGMFPEGTRKRGPLIEIENRGLGMLAVGNYAPIATAGIYGTESLWERISVCFGKTVQTGPLGPDNKRQRMVDVEGEYTYKLQQAQFGAYEMAGIDLSEIKQAALRKTVSCNLKL